MDRLKERDDVTAVGAVGQETVPVSRAKSASRSLRGFELLSAREREYPEVTGTEVRLTYIDKERGPVFIHELHCTIDARPVVYQGSCRVAHAWACDEWMQTTLHYLELR